MVGLGGFTGVLTDSDDSDCIFIFDGDFGLVGDVGSMISCLSAFLPFSFCSFVSLDFFPFVGD